MKGFKGGSRMINANNIPQLGTELKELYKNGYRYIARDKNGKLHAFKKDIIKDAYTGKWINIVDNYDYEISLLSFDIVNIKWEDKRETKIKNLLEEYNENSNSLIELLKEKGIVINKPFCINSNKNEVILIDEHFNIITNNSSLKESCINNIMSYKLIWEILNGSIDVIDYELTEQEKSTLKLLEYNSYKYISKDKNGEINAFKEKPKKDKDSWKYDKKDINLNKISIPNTYFLFIKWEDIEATNIQLFYKNT